MIDPRDIGQEEFAQREPLTTRLHGLIRSYPKGVGIIQEFVQNADDAGSQMVRFVLDEGSYPDTALPSPEMARLQGPALVVTNDTVFSEKDWTHIRLIGQSGKELDTTKTGRFGLGFNSVYNVTDFPAILTGERLGIFDPHAKTVAGATEASPGAQWRIARLWPKCPDLLAPFVPFGVERGSESFEGTAFRLPLRSAAAAAESEISREAFTPADFFQIVERLDGRLAELLLFLKNVQTIELLRRDARGMVHPLLAVTTLNPEQVESARKGIRDLLSLQHTELLDALKQRPTPAVSQFEHHLRVSRGGVERAPESFAVVQGLYLDPKGEVDACAREMMRLKEKAVPLAGAAARLTPPADSMYTATVYCGLPLSLESPVKAVHVNGFFDLQSDRQGLFQDQGAGGSAEVRVRWNRLLIEHCCAPAAAQVCLHLTQHAHETGTALYDHWPRTPVRESSLLDRLPRCTYSHLKDQNCILAGGDQAWRLPAKIILPPANLDDDLRDALLVDVFALPSPSLPGFVSTGFAAAQVRLATMTPAYLRGELRVPNDPKAALDKAPRACLRESKWVHALLRFCVSDDKVDDLVGVPLALMSNGTLRAFGRDGGNKVCLAGREERALFVKHRHWFLDAELQAIVNLRDSNPAGILNFTPGVVLANLPKELPPLVDDIRAERSEAVSDWPSNQWLIRAYEYLASNAAAFKQLDKSTIQKLPIVPDQFGHLYVMGNAETPLLLPAGGDSQALSKALTAAGVPWVDGDEKLLKAVRSFVDAFPEQAIWRLSPLDLIDTLCAVAPDGEGEPAVPSNTDARAIIDYLASPTAVKELRADSNRITSLKSLRLFPSKSGQLVALDDEEHQVPDRYTLPNISAEIGLLDCGKQDRWAPLYHVLGVHKLTRARLLTQVALPRLNELSREDVHEVLLWMRRELQAMKEEETAEAMTTLLRKVGETVPIECTDGEARVAQLLYHPEATFVASLLGSNIGFPDLSVYHERSDLWLELFASLGMARTPRADDIIAAVDAVFDGEAVVEVRVSRTTDIAEYLNDHWDDLKEQSAGADPQRPSATPPGSWMLSDALSCRAWLPVLQSAPRDYPHELLFNSDNSFQKPGDVLARGALDLVGSVRPVCRISRLFRLQASIGLKSDPPLDDVLGQLENLVGLAESTGVARERLAPLFHRIYDFLGQVFTGEPETLEGNADVAAIRARFSDCRCLIDDDGGLWTPSQCFESVVTHLLGRRARMRSTRPTVERGLRVLGRRSHPLAQDYAEVFTELELEHSETPIPEPQRTHLKAAYTAAAQLSEGNEFRDVPVLLEDGTLIHPANAVLDDAPWLSDRARAADVPFVEPSIGAWIVKPFGLRVLSAAMYERPIREVKSDHVPFVQRCGVLRDRIQTPLFRRGIARLLAATDTAVRAAGLQRFFERLEVVAVATLETALVWTDSEEQIDGSEGESDVVFDHKRNALVISEEALEVLEDRVATVVSNELRVDGHDLGRMAAHFAPMLRVEPEAIDRLLTKLQVRALPVAMEAVELPDAESDGLIGDQLADAALPEHESHGGAAKGDEHAPDAGTPAQTEDSDGSDDRAESTEASDAAAVDGSGTQSPLSTAQNGTTAAPTTNSNGPSLVDPLAHGRSGAPSRRGTSERASGRNARRVGSGSAGTSESPSASTPRQHDDGREHRGRARTYVSPKQDKEQQDESPERQTHRRRVDQAAVQRVLQYERDCGRNPTEMEHSNEGYDIESFLADGKLGRYIEVKGISGAWSEFGVPVSRKQFQKGQKETSAFWLYVVEFALEPNRAQIYAIQNPTDLIDEYWFDGGWREYATERGGGGMGSAPTKGSKVVVDGSRRGTVANVHTRGRLMHLDIDFDGAERQSLVYNPRRIQVVREEERA